jgi:hypothetical protein
MGAYGYWPVACERAARRSKLKSRNQVDQVVDSLDQKFTAMQDEVLERRAHAGTPFCARPL